MLTVKFWGIFVTISAFQRRNHFFLFSNFVGGHEGKDAGLKEKKSGKSTGSGKREGGKREAGVPKWRESGRKTENNRNIAQYFSIKKAQRVGNH